MEQRELRPFEVVRTAKIRDNRGEYVRRGEIAMLNKDTAEHYHRLGFIQVPMKDLFRDEKQPTTVGDGPDAGADETASESVSDGAKSSGATGGDDKAEASADAKDDAGASETKTSSGSRFNRRRKRASG